MRRNTAFLLATTLLVVPAAAAMAQDGDAGLGPRLQDATIIGRGDTITIKRLPVRTANGVVYRNITIELKLDETGALEASTAPTAPPPGPPPPPGAAAPIAHIAQEVATHDVAIGQITETAAAPESAAPFTQGFYRDVAGGGMVHLVNTGRTIHTQGFGIATAQFPTWTLSAVGGDTAVSAAHWYAGPIRTNPNKTLIDLAGVTDDGYSYGIVDADGAGGFDSGMLIGAKEAGDELTLVSFHKSGCCTYSSTPTAEVTYTLIRNR